jgi:hypothetical protein
MINDKLKTEAVPYGPMFDAFGEDIKQIDRVVSAIFFSPKALTNNVRRTQIPFIINNYQLTINNYSSFKTWRGRYRLRQSHS